MSAPGEPLLNRGQLLSSLAFILAAATVAGQSPSPSSEHIAFRVDAERVVATVLVRDVNRPQVRKGLSRPPVARFGYEYFEPPDYWGDLRNDHKVADRWLIHTAPGQVLQATVERRVGGYVGCEEAVGVLLRVAPQQTKTFGAIHTRYFVATPAPAETPGATTLRSTIRTLPADALTPDVRRSLESILSETLARELPRVRSEAAPFLTRGLTAGYRQDRSWARERLQIEESMERGRGRLHYNLQAFQLSPDRMPVFFVRAEWLVGKRQGFAASLWLRAGQPIEVLDTNVKPGAWLRQSLFQGGVGPSHMGLILNVLDRDGDGWGEVLFASEGYEGRSISLLEYSPAGFQDAGIHLRGGC
jgi:hypothetical protein